MLQNRFHNYHPIKVVFFILVLCLLNITALTAQSLPVGTFGLEDYYRREQLMGKVDSNISFTIRPLNFSLMNKFPEGYSTEDTLHKKILLISGPTSWKSSDGKINTQLLPFNLQLQFNSHHPYGWNDGALIPARGLQTLICGGFYTTYGPLSIQFKPEIVLAENPSFEGFPTDHYDVVWARYYDYYNYIDLPERFGKRGYARIFWGQSSIRYNLKSFSAGISTENLWWGPGMRNSLLMSNSAPGFKHLTINTIKPVKTPIGSFEGQLIAGRLEGSGFGPLEPDLKYFGSSLYLPKPNDWRYLSGLTLNWQPKWIPGLFLGLARSFQVYSKDIGKRIGDYLPTFLPFQKINADDPINKRDQMSSVFMRWLWPDEQAEIYFEYGRNDHSRSFTDFALEPENSRAYLVGLRKIFPFNKSKQENFIINLEVTQLQQTSIPTVRGAGAWYVNKYIRHGYTNRGQLLGAGIGPGGNLQSLDISWFKGLNRIGLQAERYVHNNDFYYYAFEDSLDFRRHWVDLSLAANGEWNYQSFIFNAKLQAVRSINYEWYLLQKPGEPYFVDGRTELNIQVQGGFTYRF
ncbi:MAG: capsule assembly Wzi family protein [Daejeonella sp.]